MMHLSMILVPDASMMQLTFCSAPTDKQGTSIGWMLGLSI